MKRLLIVSHTPAGKLGPMTDAVYRGAQKVPGISVEVVPPLQATVSHLFHCNAVLFGTPENFGYMSGALKDFFDRTYEQARGQVNNLAYAVFVGAGNDGSGAVAAIDRIARGYHLRKVSEPVIVCGALTPAAIAQLSELGQAMATGLELGIY